ncbi:hypothetical protein ROS9278_00041 [Roseomonas sp. CECT 9278]|jgi:antitoxin (DNA-binding transcriptional repressor) of toxin-antitoxin stability system|nr:hypothetical protein ROS9278_00041 [Roseomonas sp. CECT 9278]
MAFEVRVSSRAMRGKLALFLRLVERGHRVVIADRGQRPVLLIPARENGHIPTRDALRLGGRFRALPAPQRRALRCPG